MTRTPFFEYGVASAAHEGENESGDKYVVASFDGGALVAVIDALGHGHDASRAADVAVRVLHQHAHEPPAFLMERCHVEMRGTRGAAISVASFDWRQLSMTWLGIGNVIGVMMYADPEVNPRVQLMLQRGGVVGDRLPALRPMIAPVARGDTLILATDGVRTDFTEMLPATMASRPLAQRILDDYARHDDDAAVLVFRFDGAS